jgi:hypothetical protein
MMTTLILSLALAGAPAPSHAPASPRRALRFKC